MEIKENLKRFGSSASPNSEKRKNLFEISDVDASSSDNRPRKRARRNISRGDADDEEEEVKSTRSSSSTFSNKTEKIDERINLDLNMPAPTEEEDDDTMFLESTWSNNVKQRDCGDGGGEEVEEIKLDLNSTPAPSEEGEGYTLEGEVRPEDWDQHVGGCDDDDEDYDGDDEDYYDDGGYDLVDEDDEGNKRIKLDLNSTPRSEEEDEEQEVRQEEEEEEEEDQRRYQLYEEEDRPVEVRYQSEKEEKEKDEEVRVEEAQVWYQEEEENQQEVRPEEEQAQYQEEDEEEEEEEEDQYCYQFEGKDQRCYQAEEKGVRSEELWYPSEEEEEEEEVRSSKVEEVVRLPNIARSNLDFSTTPTKRELEDLKNSTTPPPAKNRRINRFSDDEPEHSSDSNHSSFVCEICVQPKVSPEWFAIKNCRHAYCKDCTIKHVASKLRQNIVSIPCPSPDCASGSLSPEHCRPILPPDLFDSWASAL